MAAFLLTLTRTNWLNFSEEELCPGFAQGFSVTQRIFGFGFCCFFQSTIGWNGLFVKTAWKNASFMGSGLFFIPPPEGRLHPTQLLRSELFYTLALPLYGNLSTCSDPRYRNKRWLMAEKTELYIIFDLSIISHPPNPPWPHCWGSASGTSTGSHVLFTQKTSAHISSFPPSHGPIRQKGWRRAGGFEVLKKTERRTKINTWAGVEGLEREKVRL